MIKEWTIDIAERVACLAHAGQERENGEPYIKHPKRVVEKLVRVDEKCIAWLHDVLEDTGCTETVLRNEGIPEDIITAVKFLTRAKDQNYYDYIMNIMLKGPISTIRVKLADLSDNLTDLKEGSRKDKYRFAYKLLEVEHMTRVLEQQEMKEAIHAVSTLKR
jgi:(p)ppGpp synthase/HD superfamily hydrolase